MAAEAWLNQNCSGFRVWGWLRKHGSIRIVQGVGIYTTSGQHLLLRARNAKGMRLELEAAPEAPSGWFSKL